MDAGELARDTSGVKAYAAFLTELGEKVPGEILPHVSLLMGLMDGEAYTMRNAVLGILGAIVRTVLLTDRTPEGVASRDQVGMLHFASASRYDLKTYSCVVS